MTHALRLPGDFSTPEAILDDPGVKRALEAAAKAGFPLTPHLETDPPDLSGLFRREDRAGRFVATSNGSDVNIRLAGSEYRLTAYRDLTLDDASVSFTRGKRSAFSLTRGALVRGTDEGYTTYTRTKERCTLADAEFSFWSVGISADSEASDGTTQTTTLRVTVATEGKPNRACSDYFVADMEEVGGWSVVASPADKRISPSQADFMCVDESSAYVPTEHWTRKDGKHCECTEEHSISCET